RRRGPGRVSQPSCGPAAPVGAEAQTPSRVHSRKPELFIAYPELSHSALALTGIGRRICKLIDSMIQTVITFPATSEKVPRPQNSESKEPVLLSLQRFHEQIHITAFGKAKHIIQMPSIIIIVDRCLYLQLDCCNPKACSSVSAGVRMIMTNITGHLEQSKGKDERGPLTLISTLIYSTNTDRGLASLTKEPKRKTPSGKH
ncbi:hypothetical protein DBR06_SOUSAS7410036, partial [Sousa chinensis]